MDIWIQEGILSPVSSDVVVTSVVPLMAVEQTNRGKVWPVLDFRQLNEFVSSHPGGSTVCDETVQKWRQHSGDISLVDLRKAYLQLWVDPVLWKHQIVLYKDKYYYLTRLGFGLNCASKIMSQILQKVLSIDATVKAGMDHYIDDILMDESVVSADQVVLHLQRYGLRTKPSEHIHNARVLGLQVSQTNGQLKWRRGNNLPEIPEVVSRWQLFSMCGQLVGHYPVAGWLRVACGFIKRHSKRQWWEDNVGEKAKLLLTELVDRVQRDDPVRGSLCIKGKQIR